MKKCEQNHVEIIGNVFSNIFSWKNDKKDDETHTLLSKNATNEIFIRYFSSQSFFYDPKLFSFIFLAKKTALSQGCQVPEKVKFGHK
jgi:hypothetical protein